MKENLSLFALLATLLCFTSSCVGKVEGKLSGIAYPMRAGAVWEYRMSGSMNRRNYTATASLTNLAQRKVNGILATPQKLVVRSQIRGTRTNNFYLAEDSSGLFGFGEGGRTGFSPNYYVIKSPLEVGTSWESETRDLWLDESIASIGKILHTVESTNETVVVPAGTYNQCVKIRVNLFARRPGGPGRSSEYNLSSFDINTGIEGYLWFAPGVGLVKATYRQGNVETVDLQLQSHR